MHGEVDADQGREDVGRRVVQAVPESVCLARHAQRGQGGLRHDDAGDHQQREGGEQQEVEDVIKPDLARQPAERAARDVDNPVPVQRDQTADPARHES